MKIYDCILFNDENTILEIRLNILTKFVDYFIIIESKYNHQGKVKGKKINSNILKKFNNKIKYFYLKEFKNFKSSWEFENYQRNMIRLGLKKCNSNDIILVSDVDEIPRLNDFDFSKIKNQVIAFKQFNMMYKLNLIRDKNWIGTKLCKFKNLKSPQWLRNLKVHKKYPFYRIDKIFFEMNYYHNFKIVNNGGWHFGWIRNEKQIISKLKSFAHTEYNLKKFKNFVYLNKCIKKKINFLDSTKLQSINIQKLPSYIQNNLVRYKKIINL